MEDGMRLKVVDGPILPARTHNIHNNGHDREINRNTTIGDKLSNTTLIHSKQWANDYSSLTSDNGNFNLTSIQTQDFNYICQQVSPDDSLADDDDGTNSGSSSSDSSPEAEYRSISQTSDSDSEDVNLPSSGRGILNPNYPGFQDFADLLNSPGTDSEDDSCSVNNNNNETIESVNQLDSGGSFRKSFYDKPKFDIPLDTDKVNVNAKTVPMTELVKDLNIPRVKSEILEDSCSKLEIRSEMAVKDSLKENNNKMADAFLSGIKEEIQKCAEDANRNTQTPELVKVTRDSEDVVVPRKKEKMEINFNLKMNRGQPANLAQQTSVNVSRQAVPARNLSNRRLISASKEKNRHAEILGSFDVYNIETAMPKIDLEAIESHLKAAREEERRRRNDREEIRRRLATGCDADEYYGGERPGRKPSLQARLQSGMNLQICFMNDTMSDNESPSTEIEPSQVNKSPVKYPLSVSETIQPEQKPLHTHSNSVSNKSLRGGLSLPLNQNNEVQSEADFFMKQARLQAEARVALAQAKDMARLQMEVERQRKQASPITEMLRQTLHKVGIVFPQDRRRVSRQMLTDMNLAQLQVIVNDLHTQIEYLNESLVKFLMERDDLHMSQDSMLVDIEDLTRYLGAKEDDFSQNNNILLTKPKINRIAGLIRK